MDLALSLRCARRGDVGRVDRSLESGITAGEETEEVLDALQATQYTDAQTGALVTTNEGRAP